MGTGAPALITNIVEAWDELVTFTAAANHGCQCRSLLTVKRFSAGPIDELDKLCLVWTNAIKCQRFEGGICEGLETDEMPSYTNFDNCNDNQDPCAVAQCKINKEFASRVNAMSEVSVTVFVDPDTQCFRVPYTPTNNGCCFNDLFMSAKYDSNHQSCVNGQVQCLAGRKQLPRLLATGAPGVSCEECPPGTFSEAGSDSCTPCPDGLHSAVGAAECIP